jgi:hypothetical protein
MHEIFPDEVRHAGDALDSIGALARVARGRVLPAYAVAGVLKNLRDMAGQLPDALDEVAKALSRSGEDLHSADLDGGEAMKRSAGASEEMRFAAEVARVLSSQLEASLIRLTGEAGGASE